MLGPVVAPGGTVTSPFEIDLTAIGTGTTAGATVKNTTAAAAGSQQYSPMVVLTGAGWKSSATAASQTWDWAIQNRPVQGTTVSTSALHFMAQMDGGGYTSYANLTNAGDLSVLGLEVNGNAAQGEGIFVPANRVRAFTFAAHADGGGLDAAAAQQLWLATANATLVKFGHATMPIYQSTPSSAPTDGTLFASSSSIYIDEAGNNLKFRVKYAGGTLKTGTLALV